MSRNPLKVISQRLKKREQMRELDALSAQFRIAAAPVDGSAAFARLNTFSLAFSSLRVDPAQIAAVNLLIPELAAGGIFAGVRTALEFGILLAGALRRPLRIIGLRGDRSEAELTKIRDYIESEFPGAAMPAVGLHVSSEMSGFAVHRDDVWIATYWTTAHALDVAARLAVLRASQVVYLVQDYEPGFFAWSTEFALARATYQAGFHQVVNSSPLARYLQREDGIETPDHAVFAPSLDMRRLAVAAAARTPSTIPRVFFYARPSKPRNLYVIGLSALHIVAAELHRRGMAAVFRSAGESHEDVSLSPSHRLVSEGKLPWDRYFDLLGETDVVLSLQHSPHPSHPPLDAVTSGCLAVTNELGGTRAGLHPRLLVAEPNPSALAAEILKAIDLQQAAPPAAFDAAFATSFGHPMDQVVASLVHRMAPPKF